MKLHRTERNCKDGNCDPNSCRECHGTDIQHKRMDGEWYPGVSIFGEQGVHRGCPKCWPEQELVYSGVPQKEEKP